MRTTSDVFEADQYFYHPDHLGSSSYVTDIDGEIFQHVEYFPFGETWVEESSNTQRTPYLFTGKELDEQTGLYYFGARYYDPRTSVWQSPDPILAEYLGAEQHGEGIFTPANLNLYGYVQQNPINAIDPNGEYCVAMSDTVMCRSHPDSDVPAITFPRPGGWPNFIGTIDGESEWGDVLYHDYDYELGYSSGSDGLSMETLEQAFTQNPTPGQNDLPATDEGTVNNVGRIAFSADNPVISYTKRLEDGRTVLINVTQPGHEIHPGYIVQFGEQRNDGSVTLHVAGEGFGWTQSNLNPIARFMERRVWTQQRDQYLDPNHQETGE